MKRVEDLPLLHQNVLKRNKRSIFLLDRLNMKRKRESPPAIPLMPPLESTLQIETGGDSGLPINDSSVRLNAGLGGTRRFQYNNAFWSKDIFTTNTSNTIVGLLVAYYANGEYFTVLLPINLPRLCMASNAQTMDQSSQRQFQDSLTYALNLYFSASRSVIVYNAITNRFLLNTLGVNDPKMPILQSARQPPLIWEITSSGQLSLRVNQAVIDANTPGVFPEDATFYFNLITLGKKFIPTGYSDGCVYGLKNGWFGDGPYVFGFGNLLPNNGQYVDDYYNASNTVMNLIQSNLLPLAIPATPYDLESFVIFARAIFLKQAICGSLSCLCVPSKYFMVISDQLSRLQLRPMTTNLNFQTAGTIGLLFHSIQNGNIFHDATESGQNQGSMPAVNMDPMQPHDTVDLKLFDEWGNAVNTMNLDSLTYLQNVEAKFTPPSFPPAAYQSLDPFFSTNPTHDCMFPYSAINDNIFETSPLYSPNYMDPSSAIIHFGRVLGY
jgi:hypothetical protein